jgi:hypothetical protein
MLSAIRVAQIGERSQEGVKDDMANVMENIDCGKDVHDFLFTDIYEDKGDNREFDGSKIDDYVTGRNLRA